MLKGFLVRFLTVAFFFAGIPAWAADDQKCNDALSRAFSDISAKNNASQARIASNGQQGGGQQGQPSTASGNPAQAIGQLMQQMSQNNQKLAELEQKRLEQYRQIANEEYKQTMDIEDKLHDFRKKDYERRKAIQEAEMKKKEDDAKIVIKCNDDADTKYALLLKENNAKSSRSQFQTNTLGRAKGTRKRMVSERGRFYAECISKPATQLAFKLNADMLATKMRNFNIESQSVIADINYYQSKVPKLKAHMDLQRSYVEQANQIARDSLQQQAQMQQQAMMMMMLSSIGSGSPGGSQAAANYGDTRSVINDWERISEVCKSGQSHTSVPADMYGYFNAVNSACRGGSQNACVKNNNNISPEGSGSSFVGSIFETSGDQIIACSID